MPQIINTNIASLNAQRNLNASQGEANTALERLSSGLRINSAKDDAAGLAISTRFESQIRGLNMAQRNANDGISLAQTAEGALDEVTNNLQRIRELAVQSANATNSISDRQALNQEVQQRISEINRVASQTSFNGLKVLDGTFGTQTFQVGANSGETIGISGLDSRGSKLGSTLQATEGLASYALSTEPRETPVDVSGLDFNTSLDVAISIGGEDLNLLSGVRTDASALADEINTAIGNNANLTGLEAGISDDGNSIVFTNSEGSEVAADISINDSSGNQVSVTGNDLEPLGAATFTEGSGELFSSTDIGNLTLTTETTVEFSYDDGNGDSDTVSATLGADGANDVDTLAEAINTQLATDGLDGKFNAVVSDGAINIQNLTTDQDFDFSGVQATDSDTPTTTTINTGDFALNAGTVADNTAALTGDISTLKFEDGVTGSLNVAGETLNFELDAATSNDINDLSTQVQNALTDAGYTDLTVSVIGGNSLEITNSSTSETYEITGFSAADGGTPNNTVTSSSPIEAADARTLADSFQEGETYDVRVNINGEDFDFDGISSLNDIVSQVNARSNDTGIEANLNRTNDEIYFSSQFGEDFDIAISADLNGDGTFDVDEAIQQVEGRAADDTVSMNDIDISTAEGADIAMVAVDYAIDNINGFRAELGAVQNRFESTIANLSTTSENLSASNSRIRDADFAAETAELARTQVLQSAGLSVLSQANARPQQVLQLLQG